MQELDDIGLLRQYTENNSEEAFGVIVARHLNKVYSVALRHTGNVHQAEEITQAVFVILAKKAARLGKKVILSGWLYETARLTSITFLRSEIRRARREQEAYMQNILNEPALYETCKKIAPMLDAAMANLNKTDRNAVVLRFFDGKSIKEVGAVLGTTENTAKKRLSRAVGKLHRFFARRGVSSTTAIIAGVISSNSVQAAPVTLAKTVTVVATAKGAAASASILTLAKGALKVMAWTKAQTAVIAGVGVLLLAAGTTTVALKEYEDNRTYSWEVPRFNNITIDAFALLAKTPPQVCLLKSKYSYWVEGTPITEGTPIKTLKDGTIITLDQDPMSLGIGVTADQVIQTAYSSEALRTLYRTKLPQGRYDFIANLPHDAFGVLQTEIKKKWGLVGKWEMVKTNVLLMTLANPETDGFRPAKGFGNRMESLRVSLQAIIAKGSIPVIDGTGLTNRYDFNFVWPQVNTSSEAGKQKILDALYDQLGLALVPTNMPIKMLVVEKAP